MEKVLKLKRNNDQGLTCSSREARSARRRHLLAALAFLTVSFAVLIGLEAYRCAHDFVVTTYTLRTPKVTEPVTMLMISDLHGSRFGENNVRLIDAARGQEPDVILCVGDMVTCTDTEKMAQTGIDLLGEMADIAPVYMSLGNHELEYVDRHGPDLLHKITDSGVKLLALEYADIEPNGQHIRIGGTSEYCFNYGLTWEDYHRHPKYLFLTDFCDTRDFSILLCHRPTAYYLPSEAESYEDWDCDLVLCGHTHGGLWQLPYIGSLYLPQQGFFPKLDLGLKDMGNADMIIGAGLGHEAVLFRLFDPCELVVIKLVPEA